MGLNQTNGFGTPEGTAVFPTISRLNHGCVGSTSAIYKWNAKKREMEVRIVKEVPEGVEILVSYWDNSPYQTREVRR
jgi:hypothetical protein